MRSLVLVLLWVSTSFAGDTKVEVGDQDGQNREVVTLTIPSRFKALEDSKPWEKKWEGKPAFKKSDPETLSVRWFGKGLDAAVETMHKTWQDVEKRDLVNRKLEDGTFVNVYVVEMAFPNLSRLGSSEVPTKRFLRIEKFFPGEEGKATVAVAYQKRLMSTNETGREKETKTAIEDLKELYSSVKITQDATSAGK